MGDIIIKKCKAGCGKDVYGRKRYCTECIIKRKKIQSNKYAKKKNSKNKGDNEDTIEQDAKGNYICCDKKMMRISQSKVVECQICEKAAFIY